MTDIAIIGMAGRFPGAANVESYWSNLCSGTQSIRNTTEEELRQSGVSPSVWGMDNYIRKAAFPEGVELFDARLFGYSPGEAAIIDPQHRLLLECAHEALEDAGHDPDRYQGAISVFAGCSLNTYLLTQLMSFPDLLQKIDLVQLNIASSPDFLATRISYKLGLRGVSHTVQCACSTSLVAVHLACQNLLSGESDTALAGGVALNLHLRHGYSYIPGGMFSARGECRAFDSEADGTVFGNGAGMVVLKRCNDAVRDRDRIYAVIKGSAVNNDGSAKVGYTAPSVEGQAHVIAEALSNADISADTVGYVEAHGTGTPLGDPIEIQALVRAYKTASSQGQHCSLGSVKTNIGHLDCAAGIAGLIKTALVVRDGLIPPSVNFVTPNPHISFEETPFRVSTRLSKWPEQHSPRRAGVSAFGVGGTNAHLILEEWRSTVPHSSSASPQLLIYSAATESALETCVSRVNTHMAVHPETALEDMAFTLATGRRQFEFRRIEVIASGPDRMTEHLVSHQLAGGTPPNRPPVVFMFPGQGSQIMGMGKELYASEVVFRQTLDTCLEHLSHFMDRDPRTLLEISSANAEFEALLQRTDYGQPFLFAFEYALAQLWMSWGVKPDLLIGHSLGEYVAACISGTIKLEEVLKLVSLRGRLMQATEPGAMLSVPLGAAEAAAFSNSSIALAAINSPSQCVFSGAESSIDALHQLLEGDGVHARRLSVQKAFHSSLMDPILREFRECLEEVSLMPPQIPWMSNLTGTQITDQQAVDRTYWVDHLRGTVRFYDNLKQAHTTKDSIFLEVGPQRVLQQLATRLPLSANNQIAIASTTGEKGEYASALAALGQTWLRGVPIDWIAFHANKSARRVSLPTYPFERQRCWVERPSAPAVERTEVQEGEMPETQNDSDGISISMHNRPRLATAYVAPSTPTQVRLVSILEPVFGISPLGIRDNFFALGADSLMAVAVVAKLKEHYGVQLTAVHLYEALDISSLATLLEEMVAESLQIATLPPSLPLITEPSGMA